MWHTCAVSWGPRPGRVGGAGASWASQEIVESGMGGKPRSGRARGLPFEAIVKKKWGICFSHEKWERLSLEGRGFLEVK